MISSDKIIVALDSSDPNITKSLLNQLQGTAKWVKVGMELYYSSDTKIIHAIKEMGFSIFLDLKLHDIPNTVYHSLKNLNSLPIDMINVHCLGGLHMLKEARRAIDESTKSKKPLLIGVTLLTSHSENEINQELQLKNSMNESVLHLANLAHKAGLDGVVASSREAKILKTQFGSDFKVITPGIRLSDDAKNDQQRTLTPKEAISEGSDFLVIGRPITKATHPKDALINILKG